MAALSTHVLDTVEGRPAVGMAVTLSALGEDGAWVELAAATTDDDGRAHLHDDVGPGTCRLAFATAQWTAGAGLGATTFAEVVVAFFVAPSDSRLHIPLLLSPHGYTTYRGS